jgi:NitT/TauT family transport system substrate-binding protein/putative hydroxymethylpyrimidine transport system substrate-binding protein
MVAAPLATALAALALAGCGGGGAEPGAPHGATLLLDFQPNAVHTGIYAAERRGFYRRSGVDIEIQQPGASTDAPKLLAAHRVDFAILDIHDLGIAREKGLGLIGVVPIVQRPLASVIARSGGPVRRPRDLEGRRAGVTGLPSDDAVLDSVVAGDGGRAGRVDRVTIGFDAVADLAAGRVDAATGFWNAEAVALRRKGIGVRVFKVDRYGAPPYPELILCTTAELAREQPGLLAAVRRATDAGYRFTLAHPGQALGDLLDSAPGLDPATERTELRLLLGAFRPVGALRPAVLRAWARWDLAHRLLARPLDVSAAFPGLTAIRPNE